MARQTTDDREQAVNSLKGYKIYPPFSETVHLREKYYFRKTEIPVACTGKQMLSYIFRVRNEWAARDHTRKGVWCREIEKRVQRPAHLCSSFRGNNRETIFLISSHQDEILWGHDTRERFWNFSLPGFPKYRWQPTFLRRSPWYFTWQIRKREREGEKERENIKSSGTINPIHPK